jgi:hypothetical protein
MPPQPDDARDRDLTMLVTALASDAAPMTRAELEAVREHFAELARLMLISGTVFAAMRHVAMQMHNRALAQIAGVPSRPSRSGWVSVTRCYR